MSNSGTAWEQEYKFNTNNVLVTEEDIIGLIRKYIRDKNVLKKFRINDINIYIRAFAQKSYVKEQHKLSEMEEHEDEELYIPEESNERLEFLGDRMIDATICHYLHERFSKQDEGFLTKMKIKLVKTEGLCKLAKYAGFEKWLLISSHLETLEHKNQGRNNPKVLENTFEAFVGAIVKDNPLGLGYELCYHFVVGILETHIVFHDLILKNDNYIDSLVRYSHSQKWKHPTFIVVYHKGKTNDRTFCVTVLVNKTYVMNDNSKPKDYQRKILGMIKNQIDNDSEINDHNMDTLMTEINKNDKIVVGMGYGKSKKLAEQLGSKFALMNLNIPLNF